MKKIIAVITALLTLLALGSCINSKNPGGDTTTTVPDGETATPQTEIALVTDIATETGTANDSSAKMPPDARLSYDDGVLASVLVLTKNGSGSWKYTEGLFNKEVMVAYDGIFALDSESLASVKRTETSGTAALELAATAVSARVYSASPEQLGDNRMDIENEKYLIESFASTAPEAGKLSFTLPQSGSLVLVSVSYDNGCDTLYGFSVE